jgi:hypothetical protein
MSGGQPTINVFAHRPFDRLRTNGLIQRFLSHSHTVIPAQAGIQWFFSKRHFVFVPRCGGYFAGWIPACAGMTNSLVMC